jgi:cytochrome c oxidase subunit III
VEPPVPWVTREVVVVMVKTVTGIERERVTRKEIGLGDIPPPRNGSNGNGSRGNGGGGGGGGDDRARHSQHKARIAMWVALCSILMLFTALVSAYIFLAAGGGVRPVKLPLLLWLSTALIVTSSLTLKRAVSSLKQGSDRSYSRWLSLTVALGLAFLASQLLSWRQLVEQGIYLAGNPHSTFFYLLTGMHGAHLVGGIMALNYLLLRTWRLSSRSEALRKRQTAASVVALYWHFMDVLWVSLFLFLLLWR